MEYSTALQKNMEDSYTLIWSEFQGVLGLKKWKTFKRMYVVRYFTIFCFPFTHSHPNLVF